MPRSPSDFLIRIQDGVRKLLEKNGTKLPAFNDPIDAIVARYAIAGVMKKAAEAVETEAKAAVLSSDLNKSIEMLKRGAPAMSVYTSHYASLNAEWRGRTTTDSKILIMSLHKLAEDNPKLKDRIDNIIAQSQRTNHALYLTPTLNAVPDGG